MNTRQIHYYNEIAAIAITFLLNSLLIFCVFVETEKFLRSYKNVILFSCFSEFLFLAIVTYVRPQVLFLDDALIMVLNGPIRGASQTHLNIATCFCVWSVCYDCTKLAENPSVLRLLLMTAAVYIGTSFHVICLYTSFSADPIAYREILSDPMWTEEDGSLVRFAVSDTKTWGCRAFVLYASIVTTMIYGVIVVCSRKITFVLNAQSAIFSSKTRKLQRGMNYMLLLNAAIPVCISVIPAISCLIVLLFGFGSKWMSLLVSMMFHWTACVGPALTLICIPTYRSRVFSILCFRPNKRTNSIVPIDSRLRHSRPTLPHIRLQTC
ncbi:hypothetical protein M3Y98_00920800 [Aphelenchoides besseyi]|nr:hypothetical protein M3Y98_00920800 [Aphelenchoides besseyi]KAI6193437.1 hypothetical protein M3Y96_01017600 [Aphelenchoides besseyi]